MKFGILTTRGWIMDKHLRGFAAEFPSVEAAMAAIKARGERAHRFLKPQIIPLRVESCHERGQ